MNHNIKRAKGSFFGGKMNLEFAEKLVNADAIAGNEKEVYNVLKTELENVSAKITQDNIGSFVAESKHSGNLRVMLAAHMDEVGFVVSKITDEGFVFMKPVGGWWSQVILAQKVRITTRMGKKIKGITGSIPPHILSKEARKKPVELDDVYIDLGVDSKKDVIDLGINIGDMITPDIDFAVMNSEKYLLAKAWDNRIGCYIMSEVMKRIEKDNLECTVYGVATSSEEIGLRGARTAANYVNPDVAIAIDTSIDGSTPQINGAVNANLGKGPIMLVMDATLMAHVGLRNYLIDLAQKHNIDYQLDILMGGGTDGGAIHVQKSGIPSISLVIATRYLHSHTSIIYQDDVNQAIELVYKFLKEINYEKFQQIKLS